MPTEFFDVPNDTSTPTHFDVPKEATASPGKFQSSEYFDVPDQISANPTGPAPSPMQAQADRNMQGAARSVKDVQRDVEAAESSAVGHFIKSPYTLVKGMGNLALHPVQAGQDWANAEKQQFEQGKTQLQKGGLDNLIGGIGSLVSAATGTAQFGQSADEMVDQSTPDSPNYNPDAAGGNFGETAGGFEFAPKVVSKAAGAVNSLRNIVPRQATANALVTKGLTNLDPENIRQSVIDDSQQQVQAAKQQGMADQANTLKDYKQISKDLSGSVKKAPSNLYRQIDRVGEDGEPLDPQFVKIKAPIPIKNTQAYAKTALKGINEAISGAPISDNPLTRVARNLQPFADEEPAVNAMGGKTGIAATEFSKLRALHDSIRNALTGKVEGDTTAPNPVVEHLTELNKAVTKDIDNGLQRWDNGAYQQWADRNTKWIELSNKVNENKAQGYLKLGIDPETTYDTLAKGALESPNTVRDFIAKTGDRDNIAKMALRKVMEDNIKDGDFNARQAMYDLRPDKNKIPSALNQTYAEAIPSNVRTQTAQFFKELSSNQDSRIVKTNRLIRVSHFGRISVAGIPASYVLHGIVPHAGVLAAAAVPVGAIKLAGFAIDHFMQNPKLAQAMIEGAKMPEGSPAAMTTQRILLNGMRGMGGLTASDENNNEYNAEVNNDGKIVLSPTQ